MKKPLVLAILDGFGVSLEKVGNPVSEAKMPTLEEFEMLYPFTTLQASGVAVGLPWGEAGNSEVGHLTIGSGRMIHHHLPRIISSIRDGSFMKNTALLGAAKHVRSNHSRLHIAGLISSGSVHSYIDHLYALLEFVRQEDLAPVFIHIFTDGRDAPPNRGASFIQHVIQKTQDPPDLHYVSVIGRTYAMDREDRWDNIQQTYELLTQGVGEKISSIPAYLQSSYNKGIFDPVIQPALIAEEGKEALGRVRENDALIFLNFREDSMREITHAFVDEEFQHFKRVKIPNLYVTTMTEYQKGLLAHPAFPALDINFPLSRILSDEKLAHLHVAETEKYAHVTYFFNGGREDPFPGEHRILVKTPHVGKHIEYPEMQAHEITAQIIENLSSYDVVIANYANADLVGHSGNYTASIHAVETLDDTMSQLSNAVLNAGGTLIITADHGNIELKRNALTGEKLTEHSLNPVPLYLIGKEFRRKKPRTKQEIIKQKQRVDGIITDVSPTILELLGLQKPHEMTGNSLLALLRSQ